tara:strand:+ start:1518 stop:2519 length:1002 start_codon:yes stop_codon:yes gene_type:complete
MTPIKECLINKSTKINPVWLMRQAGRYLPEFKEIRRANPDFIKLCLNHNLAEEITLQPIKRFGLDAAIIFSDILMIPYGMGQSVEFKKNFGPRLGDLELNKLTNVTERDLANKLSPIYQLLSNLRNSNDLKNRDLIGFVGAPWTLLVYMVNKVSPKNGLSQGFFKDKVMIDEILSLLDKFIKIHIENQIRAGATIIQIFDSWAGLIQNDFDKFLYKPTLSLVNHVKNLGVPVICFPRGIADYIKFTKIVKPSMINIDYNVDPEDLIKSLDVPVQGGLDPKILLSDKQNLKKQIEKYLKIFKDHPYVFNLGHGILPETKVDMVYELVETVRNYK